MNHNIVHCDLAARNVLISEGFVLKIGDFGMAKEMSEKEYYKKSEVSDGLSSLSFEYDLPKLKLHISHFQGRIPVKWTAPEALEEHVFTHKSDM